METKMQRRMPGARKVTEVSGGGGGWVWRARCLMSHAVFTSLWHFDAAEASVSFSSVVKPWFLRNMLSLKVEIHCASPMDGGRRTSGSLFFIGKARMGDDTAFDSVSI